MQCRRGLAMRITVGLSVRPSVKRVNVTKQKKDLSRFLYHTKDHFLIRRMVDGGDSFNLKLSSTGPRWSEIAEYEPIFARSASSAVTPSEKKLN